MIVRSLLVSSGNITVSTKVHYLCESIIFRSTISLCRRKLIICFENMTCSFGVIICFKKTRYSFRGSHFFIRKYDSFGES